MYAYIYDGWYNLNWDTSGAVRGVPTGTILIFAGAEAKLPAGYALCNGATASRTTYAELYNLIGTTYGVGDGVTTFNLPDLRQRFPLGVYSTTPSLGLTGGSFTCSGTTDVPSGYTGASPGANALTTVHTHAFSGDCTNPYLGVNFIIKL
jgi:microcystin-dependent protein